MSRASERYTFRQFCERAEQERQCDEEERMEADELRQIAVEVLTWFDLESHVDRFLACADGLALLANCCNCAAKWFDSDLYDYKPFLIRLASMHPEADAWSEDGIVYLETGLGQVSFHAFYSEEQRLPEANGRTWSGLEYQMNAPLVAQAFIEDWSKDVLLRKIDEQQIDELAA